MTKSFESFARTVQERTAKANVKRRTSFTAAATGRGNVLCELQSDASCDCPLSPLSADRPLHGIRNPHGHDRVLGSPPLDHPRLLLGRLPDLDLHRVPRSPFCSAPPISSGQRRDPAIPAG